MAVYMIQAGENGPVKIGVTGNVWNRFMALQTDHYVDLSILRVFEGDEVQERLFHNRFAPWRIRGEWFHFHPDMIADLGVLELDFPRDRKRSGRRRKLPSLMEVDSSQPQE